MKHFVSLIRMKHWVKNGFVFIPAFFGGVLFNQDNLVLLIAGFFCFSFVASAIYVINDYRDIEVDRNHPEKKNRPLASGAISPTVGFIVATIFLIAGIALAFFVNTDFLYIILTYLVINLGYSLGLKNISILDIMMVASGFLLRTIAGGVIIDISLSQWLLIMVFLGALFIALAKRLDDLILAEQSGTISRKVKNYNLNFVYSGITMISGVSMVSYIMYTISAEVTERLHSDHLYFTSIFVVAGILRYLQISLVEKNSGSPTKILLTDRFLITTILCWILSFYVIIYMSKGL
ncbi:decaprenyl-phosphate phosphoribosyltransferase [Pseudochryseolinea flava]|uniref:Decaprenyl-phosphate phosphoribosyltransferase n=1 Tax=Pseudochryseolinea flava TaxID=2059302 RepID=A0A364Y6A3_9BACT|nr:decaprenyl-phosphate phosphoribosyltransferase [Pseudochryseolinea flava]RAW01347.1 decaprenyl-phosphate phosphoribosyltransferase [Pseudochryseolinea flava]